MLDGQHRLWGYNKCSVRHRVPVAIYWGLNRATEAKLFIDINTTQRGVPAALLLDIKQIAKIESGKEQLLRTLFDKLREDSHSPLKGRLSPTKSQAGQISRVTFNRAVNAALNSGALLDTEGESRYKLILNYLNAFDAELPDKKLLLRSAYFDAIFEIFDEVVRSALAAHKNVKKDSLQKTIRPLANLTLGSGTGSALPTKKVIAKVMQDALRKDVVISDEML